LSSTVRFLVRQIILLIAKKLPTIYALIFNLIEVDLSSVLNLQKYNMKIMIDDLMYNNIPLALFNGVKLNSGIVE